MAAEDASRNTFSWFPKLTDTMAEVARDFPERASEFMLAVMAYGTDGAVPDFDNVALKYAFMAVRSDIDNSICARRGNKGGRPRKQAAPRRGDGDGKRGYAAPETSETGVCEVSDVSETPETSETPSTVSKAKVSKTNTGKESACEDSGFSPAPDFSVLGWSDPGEFEPPSEGEVRAYFGANCLRGDPAEFIDHFGAQGWVRSNGQPIADWRAQARLWSRRQVEFDQSKPVDLRAPERPLPAAENARDYEAELAALDARAPIRAVM